MSRPVPECAVRFVSAHEGCKLDAYQDSVGVWTIGYGHTGAQVVKGYAIAAGQAVDLLRVDLATAAERLASKVKAPVLAGLTENQYAALLSFVFNLGVGNWTIWKRLNNGELDRVPMEMMKFVNAGGRKVQGLVNRRAAEVVLWSTDEPGSSAETPPSSQTRNSPTPPTPMDKPVAASKTFWTAASVTIGGLVTGVQQIQALALQQAAHSDLVAKLSSFAAVLIVGGGIAIMAFRWLDSRSRRS